jgi:hypothetical protein
VTDTHTPGRLGEAQHPAASTSPATGVQPARLCPRCEDLLWMADAGESKDRAAARVGWADGAVIDTHLKRHRIPMPRRWQP